MIEGWVCIGRKMTEWEWYSDSNVVRLFLHLLLMANFKENHWQGRTINRGQWVSSRATVSLQTGLTIKQIRIAEAKLINSGSLVVEGANKFTVYSIVKYEEYQKSKPDRANKGQAEGNQTANKGQQLNKENKENKETNIPPTPLPDWIPKRDWDDWIAQRKDKPSKRALELSIERLAKLKAQGHPPDHVLQQSIQRGWAGLFAIKPDYQPQGGINENTTRNTSNSESKWVTEGKRLAAKYREQALADGQGATG